MFGINQRCLINFISRLVGFITLDRRGSHVDKPTPIFPPTTNVGPTYPCYLGIYIYSDFDE